jgi:hypothetical protein
MERLGVIGRYAIAGSDAIIYLLDTSRRSIDFGMLIQILSRHGMSEKWTQFLEKTSWKQP